MQPLSRRQQKAFSLIEAAIVLGIIGLVISGVWVASSTVSSRLRLKDTMDVVMQLRQTAFSMAKQMPFCATYNGVGCDSNYFDLTGHLLRTGAPGGFNRMSSSFLTNGRTYFAAYLHPGSDYYDDEGNHVHSSTCISSVMYLDVRGSSIAVTGAQKTNGPLCVAMSRHYLDYAGPPPSGGTNSITWLRQTFGAGAVTELTWDKGDPKPDTAALTAVCQTATRINAICTLP